MAHSLTITVGTETITLTGFKYTPKTPKPDDETITESVVIPALASFSTVISALNRAFNQARTYQKFWSGEPVYANFTPDGYVVAYRSEVLDGRIDHDDDTLGSQWLNQQVQVAITWTRRAYWEGPETQLPISNTSGSGTAITVYNHQDGSHDNYVEIDGDDVAGDLPTPIRVAMTNTVAGDTAYTRDVFIGHHVHGAAGALEHNLELVAGDIGGLGTVVTNSGASGGAYIAFSWTGATEVNLAHLDFATDGISDHELEALIGESVHMLTRFFTTPAANLWLRFKVQDADGATIFAGSWVNATQRTIQDLGVIRFAPNKQLSYFGYLNFVIMIQAKCSAAGTHTMNLDCFQVWPRLRTLRGANNLVAGNTLNDDQIENLRTNTYPGTLTSLTSQVPLAGPILLEPGRTQRLYFLQMTSTYSAPIDRTLLVSVWYRPRRVTL